MLDDLKRAMERLADPAKAAVLARFFRTGPGQYGQGDVFLVIDFFKCLDICGCG